MICVVWMGWGGWGMKEKSGEIGTFMMFACGVVGMYS